MQLNRHPFYRGQRGYALAVTLVIGAITIGALASALAWSYNNVRLNGRSNQYFASVSAAEAATEAVIAKLGTDYTSGGDAVVQSSLDTYRAIVPRPADSSVWSTYRFGNDLGQTGRTQVVSLSTNSYRTLSSQFHGLKGYSSTYQIVSDARDSSGLAPLTVGVQQMVETDTVPLFQFAIFYNLDLEINPGADMSVTGPMHSNQNIYTQPQQTLTFQGDVTAVGSIIANEKPGDPTSRTLGTIVKGSGIQYRSGVPSITMPIGTNNTAEAVRQVLEPPPSGELATSTMGKQRFYNQADMVIKVTDSTTTVTSGSVNNFATSVPSAQYNKFLKTTTTFYNKRENATVKATQIDVAALRTWNQTNTVLRSVVPSGDIKIVYVDDQRTQTSSTEAGVRLINGQTLLPQGLTVATPKPLYVQGDYNSPSGTRGTLNTAGTVPAALAADAITVLSGNWSDLNSLLGLSLRPATDTTVNAAFLAGIVETTSSSYSGGVENFPRFLEDWSGQTLTYNGSMVVMFDSKYADGLWQGTGSSIGIYNPPTRNWAFDTNFTDPAKLPPGTPSARAIARVNWATIRPSSNL